MSTTSAVPDEKVAELRAYIESQPDGLSSKLDDWASATTCCCCLLTFYQALRRYLGSRQMNISKSYEQIREYYAWRQRTGMDSRPEMGAPGNPHVYSIRGYDAVPDLDPSLDTAPPFSRYCGGGCFHKTAKDGTPIFIERVGKFDSKNLAASATPETYLERYIRMNEFAIHTLMAECTKKAQTNIDKQTVIFDCDGLTMNHFYLLGSFAHAISDFNAKYYPDRLQRLFIVNAPSIFPRIWGISKKWLEKRVLEKIFILGNDSGETLLKYIDASALPAYLGGKCTCSHMPNGCVPLFAPAITISDATLDHTIPLRDTKEPHVYQLTIPLDELLASASAKLTYKFRSSKRPVLFELRHRKWGSDTETVVIAATVYPSHLDMTVGQVIAQPGFYSFSWTKTPAKGLSGLGFAITSLEYTVDLQFDDDDLSTAQTLVGTTPLLVPTKPEDFTTNVDSNFKRGNSGEDDEDYEEFLDAVD